MTQLAGGVENIANQATRLLDGLCLDPWGSGSNDTIYLAPESIKKACLLLRDHSELRFTQLIDLCVVDYKDYRKEANFSWGRSRFAVVYHLLSMKYSSRLRVVVSVEDDSEQIDSVIDVWPVANWYEREAFDLFGVVFLGHPDLRRILTDYGFIGHPFRKDFPLSGHVEMHYDEDKKRVVYRPVTVEERVLVPRSIGGSRATSDKS